MVKIKPPALGFRERISTSMHLENLVHFRRASESARQVGPAGHQRGLVLLGEHLDEAELGGLRDVHGARPRFFFRLRLPWDLISPATEVERILETHRQPPSP